MVGDVTDGAGRYLDMVAALLDKGPHEIIGRLERAIEAHYDQTGKLSYIFIDELGIAQGDSELSESERAKMTTFVKALAC